MGAPTCDVTVDAGHCVQQDKVNLWQVGGS